LPEIEHPRLKLALGELRDHMITVIQLSNGANQSTAFLKTCHGETSGKHALMSDGLEALLTGQ
jgi:hypothetical protein